VGLLMTLPIGINTVAPSYAIVPIAFIRPIYLRRDEMATVRRVPKVLGKRPFVTISAPRPPIKNVLGGEGSQQPLIEENPLPLISNSELFNGTGVSVPRVPPLATPTIQIQVGGFLNPDPNFQGPIGSGRRKGQRGVYLGGFDGSGEPGEVTRPVRIISKPTPIYTEEAIRLKIQGEVVVDVQFGADAKARVVRIVERLGHGLDEAAVRAVEEILFKPASINDRAIDFVGRAHVEFSLVPPVG